MNQLPPPQPARQFQEKKLAGGAAEYELPPAEGGNQGTTLHRGNRGYEPIFRDRAEGGRILADRMSEYSGRQDVLVLALPRGGAPVAYEVARVLNLPLDVFIVRKLGIPGFDEFAMGAIATGGVRVLNESAIQTFNISQEVVDAVALYEEHELRRREAMYRGTKPEVEVHDRIIILVDDGLTTASTMRAVIAALRQRQPAEIVVAVPTAAWETCEALRTEADRVICARTPEPFIGVGRWYRNFTQTTDEEVHSILQKAEELRR